MSKVLRAGPNSSVQLNLAPISDVWVTHGLGFDAAALAFWNGNPGNCDFIDIDDAGAANVLATVGIQPVSLWQSQFGASGAVPAPVTDALQLCETNYKSDGSFDFYVGGAFVFTDTGGLVNPAEILFLGRNQSIPPDPADVVFISSPMVGTTRGAHDIFLWNETDLAQFDDVFLDVTVVDDPFSPPPAPTCLTVRDPIRPYVMAVHHP